MITGQMLKQIGAKCADDVLDVTAAKLEAAAVKAGIITGDNMQSRNRMAHFIAQIMQESAFVSRKEDMSDYTAKNLCDLWPSRFTPALASACAGNGPKVADIVYQGRMGNTQAGDGFRFAGDGWMQHTGRAEYEALAKRTGFDVVKQPELLRQIGVSAICACDFLVRKGAIAAADKGGVEAVEGVTLIVNGGKNGLKERQDYYIKAAKALGVIKIDLPAAPQIVTPQQSKGQFYYPVPMGSGWDDYHNDVGKFLDPQYYKEIGSVHPGSDLNIRRRQGESADKELGKPYGAVYAGLVVSVQSHKVWGWITEIKHFEGHPNTGKEWWSMYAHSKEVRVKVGDKVVGGQIIGTIGKGGGNKMSAHLHCEARNFGLDVLPDDFWPSLKYPIRSEAESCVRRNYFDLMAYLQGKGAVNPTFS